MTRFLKAALASLAVVSLLTACLGGGDHESESERSARIARGFYQHVIVEKNLSKFDDYVGSSYLQHATGYADGVQPLRDEMVRNAASSDKVQILRVVADGPYAALHSLWTVGTQQVLYVDLWRIENGKLVEHWDQFQNVPATALNTNTLYAGPDANPLSAQDLERNRGRALAVLKTFDNLADLSPVRNFLADGYIQHNPSVADGKAAFLQMLTDLGATGYRSRTTIAKSLAFGDMVLVHSRVVDAANPADLGTGAMDIFRFDADGRIVEHWDVLESLTGTSLNANDPFFYPS